MNIDINQNLSPIKYFLLIKPNSRNSLKDSIKCLFSTWCGTYSPIYPFYSRLSGKFSDRYNVKIDKDIYYKNLIVNYDPDVIVYEDGLDIDRITKLADGRNIILLSSFKEQLNFGKLEYGISIDKVINGIIDEEFKYKRQDNLKLKFPNNKNNNLLLDAWQGVLLDNVEDKYLNKYLKKKSFIEQIDLDIKSLKKYFSNENISLLDTNTNKAKFFYRNNWEIKVVIYFLDDSNILDVIDYWNLRALGWIILPVLSKHKKEEVYNTFVINFLKQQIKNSNGVSIANILVSDSLAKKPEFDYLNNIIKKEKLKIRLLDEFFPRFWSNSDDVLRHDNVKCPKIIFDKVRSDIEVDENDYISFSLPELPFKQNHHTKIYHKAYFSFSYSYRNDQGKYAEVISDISTDDWVSIIKEFGSKCEWRISREGIIRYIRFERDRVFFNLPTSFKFFTKFFKNKGFSIKETASGKLGKEVLKNIGGIYGINIFSTENSIKIIELFQGGKIVHLDTLVGNIKRLNPFPEFKNNHSGLIDLLLENQIIEFGVQIQCEVCEQRSFYLINDLADNLKCSVCRNTFNFPKSNPKKSLQYVYRGVGPFSRNNKVDGLLSVLLTIRLFKLSIIDGFDRGLSFLFDFEIKRKDKLFEIDLVIMADGKQNKSNTKAFICECKTFKHIERKDIERLKYVGQQIPNMILVIATLNKEFTIEEKALLIELTEFFRTKNGVTSNPILLLTGDELIPNRRHFPLKKYEDKIAGHQYVDYVNTLADLTCEEHLNLKTCDELSSEAWVEMQKKKKAVQKKVRTTS